MHLMLQLTVHLSVLFRRPLRVHLKAFLVVYFKIYIKIHKKVHLRLKLRVHLKWIWVSLESSHGGALVRAQEWSKWVSKRRTLGCTLCCIPKISLYKALKNTQKCEEKDAFYTPVDDQLESVIKGAPEGTLNGARKDSLSSLSPDAQEGAFEVALKGAPEVPLFDATVNAQICADWFI